MIIMNKISSVILLIYLSSCTNLEFYDAFISQTLNQFQSGNKLVTKDFFSSREYSFITVKIGNGDIFTMTLSRFNNGRARWVGSDGSVIETINGKIVKMENFSNDIELVESNTPFNPLSANSIFYFDFYKPKIYGLAITSSKVNRKDINFLRLDEIHNFYEITRRVEAKKIRFSTDNKYILNKEGVTLATIQKVHPHVPKVEINFYFKY